MAQAKGGRKLNRTAKHKGMYAAQRLRTAGNKARKSARIKRRKLANPQPPGWKRRTARFNRRNKINT